MVLFRWIGTVLHVIIHGHIPEWFVMGYDKGWPIWRCEICEHGPMNPRPI